MTYNELRKRITQKPRESQIEKLIKIQVKITEIEKHKKNY